MALINTDSKITGVQKTFKSIFILAFLCLSFSLFFFSIWESLLGGIFPDEIGALELVRSTDSILKSSYIYWSTSTINRWSANLVLMSGCYLLKMFSWMTWTGWVFLRFICFLTLPVSLVLFFRCFMQGPLWKHFGLAFIIASLGIFVGFEEDPRMWMLDHAIYLIFVSSFYLTLGLFIKELKNSTTPFALFLYISFSIMLNTHEIALPIGGLLIAMYCFMSYNTTISPAPFNYRSIQKFILTAFKNRKLLILLAIWSISALLTLMAPSLANRLLLWPATGTHLEGIAMACQILEISIRSIFSHLDLSIAAFSLGGLASIIFYSNEMKNKKDSTKYFLYFCILMALIFPIITGYLIGVTPSQAYAYRLLPTSLPIISQKIFGGPFYGLSPRHLLPTTIFLLVAIFIAGYLAIHKFVNFLRNKSQSKYLQKTFEGKRAVATILLLCISLFLFLLHPDRLIVQNIIQEFIRNPELTFLHPELPKEDSESMTVARLESQRVFFRRRRRPFPQQLLARIKYHNHLIKLRDSDKLYTPLPDIGDEHQSKIQGYGEPTFNFDPWINKILNQYGILKFTNDKQCQTIDDLGLGLGKDISCGPLRTAKDADAKIARIGKVNHTEEIEFNKGEGLTWKKDSQGCIEVTENEGKRMEHFLAGEIAPGPGEFASFTVNIKSLKIQNGAFYINTGDESLYVHLEDDHWHMGLTNHLQLLWKQIRYENGGAILQFLIQKPQGKKLDVRWQNIDTNSTKYKGSTKRTVSICDIKYVEYQKRI